MLFRKPKVQKKRLPNFILTIINSSHIDSIHSVQGTQFVKSMKVNVLILLLIKSIICAVQDNWQQ